MFSKQKKDFAYIFPFSKEQKITITMWWVFYTIDIIFLDADNRIVELMNNLSPFTFYRTKQKAKTFIELPKNTIKKYSLTKGQQLLWDKDQLSVSKQ